MKPCQMTPNGHCPHEAVATVRIDGIGDRDLCAGHRDFALSQGMGRVLDPNHFVPTWRKRDLGRDATGAVYAA